MPSRRLIDAVWARHVTELYARKGGDVESLLGAAGLTREAIGDIDDRIAFRQHVRLLDLAAANLGEPSFGLELGSNAGKQDFGPLGYIAMSSPTIADAFRNVVRYERAHSEGDRIRLEPRGNHVAVVYEVLDPTAIRSRQLIELWVSATLQAIRIATGLNEDPVGIEVELHGDVTDQHTRLLPVPVRFGQRRNALVFRRELLDREIVTADPTLLNILEKYCQELLLNRPAQGGLVEQVQETTARLLTSGYPTLAAVARELGMSARTLSRRLSESGQTYRGLVDDLRRELAFRYLHDHNLRLSQVAYLLGYTEIAAFTHAFRRWTGKPPSIYRQETGG